MQPRSGVGSPDQQFATFGEALRFFRRRARLTQRQLATSVGYSPEHVSRLESNARKPDVVTVRALFVPALGLGDQPSAVAELVRLCRPNHESEPPRSGPTPTPAAMTPLVGRERELAAVLDRLARPDCRLLTLVGIGGSGKTRLAIEVAATVPTTLFADGAVWVPLETLAGPDHIFEQILGALREALGLPQQRDVLDAVAGRRLLIVFDNAEQLTADLSAFSALLAAAPGVTLLVTSRTRLQLYGEWVLDIGGLASPDDAVALFQLTAARHRQLGSDPADDDTVRRICAAVGALPLAIELAASWARSLPVADVADRIVSQPARLRSSLREQPDRQRSVEAVLADSWALLSPAERQALTAAAVFRGGVDPVAVQQLWPGWIDDHGGLLDRSLLSVDPGGRLDLHPLVRAYVEERADAAGELADVRRRHADHYRRWTQAAAAELDAEQRTWLPRLEAEHDNVRAALGYELETGRVDAASEICLALVDFWSIRGHLIEGRRYLGLVLRLPDPNPLRRRLLTAFGELAWVQGDYAEARTALTEALDLHVAAGDDAATGEALHRLGSIAGYEGDYAEAERSYEASLATKRRVADEVSIAKTLTNLAITVGRHGQLERAQTLHEQAYAAFRDHGHEHFSAIALVNLADLAVDRGDADAAVGRYRAALQILHDLGDQQRAAFALDGLGRAAVQLGRPEHAARLWGASAAIRSRFATIVPPAELTVYEPAMNQARADLGTEAYESAWQVGASLTVEEVLAEALTGT